MSFYLKSGIMSLVLGLTAVMVIYWVGIGSHNSTVCREQYHYSVEGLGYACRLLGFPTAYVENDAWGHNARLSIGLSAESAVLVCGVFRSAQSRSKSSESRLQRAFKRQHPHANGYHSRIACRSIGRADTGSRRARAHERFLELPHESKIGPPSRSCLAASPAGTLTGSLPLFNGRGKASWLPPKPRRVRKPVTLDFSHVGHPAP